MIFLQPASQSFYTKKLCHRFVQHVILLRYEYDKRNMSVAHCQRQRFRTGCSLLATMLGKTGRPPSRVVGVRKLRLIIRIQAVA